MEVLLVICSSVYVFIRHGFPAVHFDLFRSLAMGVPKCEAHHNGLKPRKFGRSRGWGREGRVQNSLQL